MASYLGRNVNLALLLIIIGVVIALVTTTVFFQRGLQNKTDSYESTSTDLQVCQTALSNYQTKYTQAQAKVNETSQDIRKYDQLYEQKVGELKDSQTKLMDTQTKLEFERLQKDKFQDFYEDQLRANQQLNITVDNLRDQVADLRSDLNECRAAQD